MARFTGFLLQLTLSRLFGVASQLSSVRSAACPLVVGTVDYLRRGLTVGRDWMRGADG